MVGSKIENINSEECQKAVKKIEEDILEIEKERRYMEEEMKNSSPEEMVSKLL